MTKFLQLHFLVLGKIDKDGKIDPKGFDNSDPLVLEANGKLYRLGGLNMEDVQLMEPLEDGTLLRLYDHEHAFTCKETMDEIFKMLEEKPVTNRRLVELTMGEKHRVTIWTDEIDYLWTYGKQGRAEVYTKDKKHIKTMNDMGELVAELNHLMYGMQMGAL